MSLMLIAKISDECHWRFEGILGYSEGRRPASSIKRHPQHKDVQSVVASEPSGWEEENADLGLHWG